MKDQKNYPLPPNTLPSSEDAMRDFITAAPNAEFTEEWDFGEGAVLPQLRDHRDQLFEETIDAFDKGTMRAQVANNRHDRFHSCFNHLLRIQMSLIE